MLLRYLATEPRSPDEAAARALLAAALRDMNDDDSEPAIDELVRAAVGGEVAEARGETLTSPGLARGATRWRPTRWHAEVRLQQHSHPPQPPPGAQ